MNIPFANHIRLACEKQLDGQSRCSVSIGPEHRNSFGAMHGGVAFTLADTGMGAALHSVLEPGEGCATIEVKISYFRSVVDGTLVCISKVLHKGKSIASLESRLLVGDKLIAVASGTFAARPKRAA